MQHEHIKKSLKNSGLMSGKFQNVRKLIAITGTILLDEKRTDLEYSSK